MPIYGNVVFQASECMSQDSLCVTQQMTETNEHIVLTYSQMVYRGPLLLLQPMGPGMKPPWISAGMFRHTISLHNKKNAQFNIGQMLNKLLC